VDWTDKQCVFKGKKCLDRARKRVGRVNTSLCILRRKRNTTSREKNWKKTETTYENEGMCLGFGFEAGKNREGEGGR